MKIEQLYIYPIKSLRGISITSSDVTQQGLQYDRRFMLLKVLPDGTLENMHISHFAEMALFQTSINMNSVPPSKEMTVTYQTPKTPLVPFHLDQSRSLNIPLYPVFRNLGRIEVTMHKSPTFAYRMPDEFNSWFSNCFGFPVILSYLGDGLRKALGSISPNSLTKTPSTQKSKSPWLSSLSSYLPLPGQFQGMLEDREAENDEITFSDCAPLLVVTYASLATIHPRLRETGSPDSSDDDPVEMDMKKFRPNVVLDGDPETPWDEDFWGELTVVPTMSTPLRPDSDIGVEKENGFDKANGMGIPVSPIQIVLTGNCGRCKSINIDYETGRQAIGPSGEVLKKLMKDRRVDKGVKYSPVFGRYGFLGNWKEGIGRISVGDEVAVSRRNVERTVFQWPGLTN